MSTWPEPNPERRRDRQRIIVENFRKTLPRAKRPLAVIDFETDPFRHLRKPEPFCVEFLSDKQCVQFWGDDCVASLMKFLDSLEEPHTIFAHNGGKFDFWFLHRYTSNPLKVINARIVTARLLHHELRDSYAILPVPLRNYDKDDIDYRKLERHRREKHKREILDYCHKDCVSLLALVTAFVGRFGLKLTAAGTAMSELKKIYTFNRMGSSADAEFRPWYFGGRVQCFESGVLRGPWKAYDINSSYPKSMRDYLHPINGRFEIGSKMPRSFKRPFFVRFVGSQMNAIPARGDDGELAFDIPRGEFLACSHELEIALDHGLVKIDKVLEVRRAIETISFFDFVDKFYGEKVAAKLADDKAGEIFAKLIMNSGYGGWGLNPLKFRDWKITHDDDEEADAEFEGFKRESDFEGFSLYSRKAMVREESFRDVSVAASITSASRAQMLIGLQKATRPIYCDTDSVICESFAGEVSKTVLGAWKEEKGAKMCAIAGKKVYALYDRLDRPVKVVSKGGDLDLRQVVKVAGGGRVTYKRDAPTFSLRGDVTFIKRVFRKTAKPLRVDDPVEPA